MRRFFLSLVLLVSAAIACRSQTTVTPEEVQAYIRGNWMNTVRSNPKDSADHIGMPRPYTVPCASGTFQELYYWDTYFTNVGLMLDGHVDWAIGNTEDLASLVERFGKVLNGSRFMYADHSQPPYLCMMVADIYDKTGDEAWLRKMYPILVKEYTFWMTKRMTPCGLNHYATDLEVKGNDMGMARYAKMRTKSEIPLDSLSEAEVLKYAYDARAECESGWDFTPRFENRCRDFCPVDLNANLYFYERSLARFCKLVGQGKDVGKWLKAARRRQELMQEYMYREEDGFYYDYDFVNNRQSTVKSAAVFSLLFVQALPEKEARTLARKALSALECPSGLAATTAVHTSGTYQWAYPNGWAPLHYVAIKGMDNYGMKAEARHVAGKYVAGLTQIFSKTGNLWEKYNVVEGNTLVTSEGQYDMPPMMGWTAGVFEFALNYLEGK